jgi:hypothetical protein
MSKKISLISLFSTIFFLIITVVLGLIIHYLGDPSEPVFALFGTLFIGMFLCLLTCLSNLNYLIKIYDEQQSVTKDVHISTCPDYWTKRQVVDKKSGQQATMCHNISPTGELVYGSLDSEQFEFTNSNLTEMRDKAEYPETQEEPVLERFTQKTFLDTDDADYYKFHHYHADVVITANANDISSPYDSSIYNDATQAHPHIISGDSEYLQHSHQPGISDDELFGRKGNSMYSAKDENFNNWINPYNANGLNTIELNLKQLNNATNTCDLTRHFAWNEAEAKCPKKRL